MLAQELAAKPIGAVLSAEQIALYRREGLLNAGQVLTSAQVDELVQVLDQVRAKAVAV